jgi:hypothetical protein
MQRLRVTDSPRTLSHVTVVEQREHSSRESIVLLRRASISSSIRCQDGASTTRPGFSLLAILIAAWYCVLCIRI